MIAFTVPGQPKGKARARSGKGNHYTPKPTRDYEALIAVECIKAMRKAGQRKMLGPVVVSILAYRQRPRKPAKDHECRSGVTYKGHRVCTTKPDADNIAKAIKDGITKAGLWQDDSQAVRLMVEKAWAADGALPGVEVLVREMRGEG